MDYLAEKYDVVARFQGGPNAGHTPDPEQRQKFVLHTIPSGIFPPHTRNLVGAGVVIDPATFGMEIARFARETGVDPAGRLFISRKAHLILPTHKMLTLLQKHPKDMTKIGSTLKGIGPAYMDKTGRNGLRVGDLSSPIFVSDTKIKAKHLELLALYRDKPTEIAGEKNESRSGRITEAGHSGR